MLVQKNYPQIGMEFCWVGLMNLFLRTCSQFANYGDLSLWGAFQVNCSVPSFNFCLRLDTMSLKFLYWTISRLMITSQNFIISRWPWPQVHITSWDATPELFIRVDSCINWDPIRWITFGSVFGLHRLYRFFGGIRSRWKSRCLTGIIMHAYNNSNNFLYNVKSMSKMCSKALNSKRIVQMTRCFM